MLSAIMLSVFILRVFMLSVFMLCVVMLSVIMLTNVMLNVVAPEIYSFLFWILGILDRPADDFRQPRQSRRTHFCFLHL